VGCGAARRRTLWTSTVQAPEVSLPVSSTAGLAGGRETDGVGELAKHGSEVVASTAGDSVAPVIGQLAGFVAAATGHPELAWLANPVGVLAGAMVTESVKVGIGRAFRDRAKRYERFVHAAAEASGIPEEKLLAAAEDGPQVVRDLLAKTAAISADSPSAWKIDTMAKIFARTVRGDADPALIDEMVMLERIVEPLGEPHARYLAVVMANHLGLDDLRKQLQTMKSTLGKLEKSYRRAERDGKFASEVLKLVAARPTVPLDQQYRTAFQTALGGSDWHEREERASNPAYLSEAGVRREKADAEERFRSAGEKVDALKREFGMLAKVVASVQGNVIAPVEFLISCDPGLRSYRPIVADLQRHGLLTSDGSSLNDLGWWVAEQLHEIGATIPQNEL
jgi:hypothetical protein